MSATPDYWSDAEANADAVQASGRLAGFGMTASGLMPSDDERYFALCIERDGLVLFLTEFPNEPELEKWMQATHPVPLRLQRVPHSINELRLITPMVTRRRDDLRALGVVIASYGPHLWSNRFRITTRSPVDAIQRQRAQEWFGPLVDLVHDPNAPRPTLGEARPGERRSERNPAAPAIEDE